MKDFDFLRKANLKARKWALALTNSKLNTALRSKGTDWALGLRVVEANLGLLRKQKGGEAFRFATLGRTCSPVESRLK
ncbi:hypothetical protein ACWA77_001810 [Campylobacter upsaliensis]